MNSNAQLEKLIKDFSYDNLEYFFRSKLYSVSISKENYPIDNTVFSEGIKFAEFKTSGDNKDQIVVYCFKVNKDLTERSGKKAQYDLAKKILKQEVRYSAGIFIFYDDKHDFRFHSYMTFQYQQPKETGVASKDLPTL